MTEIFFIRHAESYGNLTRRAYGWYDGMLSPKGYKQANYLATRFANEKLDAIYSSDLTRARETAKAICERKNLQLIIIKDFREVGIGAWENLPWGEAPISHPNEYAAWTENPLEFNIEGGENYESVYNRAKAALDGVVAENEGKRIAIVSHGATLRLLMYGITRNGNLIGVEKEDWGDNTCVSLFRFENGEYHEVFRNDNSHLSSMPDYKDNMNWVREGSGRNLRFKCAKYPDDRDKIRYYHKEAWLTIFDDEPPKDRDIDAKAKRVLRQSAENIAFGYSPAGEVGMIELDEDVSVFPQAGHISVLYLRPEFRRMRYGIQLIGHAMNRYYNIGKKHLSVRVAETNTAAYAFYKKHGFYEAFRETEGDYRQIVMILDIDKKG